MNDEAISFTTLRRFQTELAIKDRQIEYLLETLQLMIVTATNAVAAINELKETK